MQKLIGSTLVLIAALSWSTAGLFTRVVNTDIPTTLFWRSLFGGICVLAISMALRKSNNIRSAFSFSIGETVIATLSTAGMVCFISAFFYTSIANVVFVYGVMPLVTYLLAIVFLGYALTWVPSFCCFTAAIGVIIMSSGNSELSDFIGISLALGMTFFMASLTVAAKFFPNEDTQKATYLSAFLGAIVVLPFSDISSVTTYDYGWLALYGLVNVGLGFGIYLLGVVRVTALTAALIGLIEIPLAPIWAYLLFDEFLNAKVIIGGVIILAAAIVYVIYNERREG